MKRELFQLGPEALRFRVDAPIVDKTMGIMAAHQAAVMEIEQRFYAEIKEARDHAEWAYRQACDHCQTELEIAREAAQ